MAEKQAKTILSWNKHGGMGKTTVTVNLAAVFASMGLRTLVYDPDENAIATRQLGIDSLTTVPNIYHFFAEKMPMRSIIKQTEFGVDVLPGHVMVGAIEDALEDGDEGILKERLGEVSSNYDYIILDNPAQRTRLGINNLVAADYLIIPFQAHGRALDALADTMRYVKDVVWRDYNPTLKIITLFPTAVAKVGKESSAVVSMARELYGDKVFPLESSYSQVFSAS